MAEKKVKCQSCYELRPLVAEFWPVRFVEEAARWSIPQASKRVFGRSNDRLCRVCFREEIDHLRTRRWWHHRYTSGEMFRYIEQTLADRGVIGDLSRLGEGLRGNQRFRFYLDTNGDFRGTNISFRDAEGEWCQEYPADAFDHTFVAPVAGGDWMDLIPAEPAPAETARLMLMFEEEQRTQRLTPVEIRESAHRAKDVHGVASTMYRLLQTLDEGLGGLRMNISYVSLPDEPQFRLAFHPSDVVRTGEVHDLMMVQQKRAEVMKCIERAQTAAHCLFFDINPILWVLEKALYEHGVNSDMFRRIKEYVFVTWRAIPKDAEPKVLYEQIVEVVSASADND